MKNILAENLLRFGVKNLSETNRKKLIEQVNTQRLEKNINFQSGYWSETGGKINQILQPELESIKQFLISNQDRSEMIQIRLAAGESKVPNRDAEDPNKPRLNPGDLSKRRYETIKSYMNRWLQSLQKEGIIKTIPPIVETKPIISGPEWNPPAGATKEQITKLARDTKYTEAQYLKVFVEVQAEQLPELEESKNSNSSRQYGQYKSKSGTTYAYGYNYKWPDGNSYKEVDKFSVPSRMLTNAGPISLNTDMSSVGGPTPFKWEFKGDSGCDNRYVRLYYDPPLGAVPGEVRFCDSYKVLVNGTTEPTLKQWQYIYMYIKKEENHYKHKDWSFISNKPNGLKPNLKLNGTPNTGGYSTDTRVYYFK